jgi:hypothetical protein
VSLQVARRRNKHGASTHTHKNKQKQKQKQTWSVCGRESILDGRALNPPPPNPPPKKKKKTPTLRHKLLTIEHDSTVLS